MLALQQATVLREHTGMDTRGYVGSMGVDLWKAHEWRSQMAHHEIMVMTHDILLNSLRHGFMKVIIRLQLTLPLSASMGGFIMCLQESPVPISDGQECDSQSAEPCHSCCLPNRA